MLSAITRIDVLARMTSVEVQSLRPK